MLKAVTTLNNRRTLFIGLERANTERLHKDEPIAIDVQALYAAVKDADGPQDIVLFAGDDMDHLRRQLAPLFPDAPHLEHTDD